MFGHRFIAVGVLALALTLPSAALGAGRVLKRGMHGPRVAVVQRHLGLPADGTFGPATKRAVVRFQRGHGLAPDGLVGPATWAALTTSRTPRSAPGGGSVATLQRALRIAADGIFGPYTEHRVKRFQARHGLTADGIVGPATWAALGRPGRTAILRRRRAPARARLPAVVRRVIRAGNRIAGKPYRYGGGHRRWNDTGYDCSGSVSYALHGGGLLAGALPSGSFMTWGAPGRGRYITIYANPDHMYMVVAGRRFDTTGRSESGTRWSREMRDSAGYTVRHPPGL